MKISANLLEEDQSELENIKVSGVRLAEITVFRYYGMNIGEFRRMLLRLRNGERVLSSLRDMKQGKFI